ncbi:hypothetical protein F5Y18DRAFT_437312 [Xylariaceae sp. FL1019]|nr:hypothetical protein F5Y18DRAFT_437312 [Xylariaceae sp. FL1019]
MTLSDTEPKESPAGEEPRHIRIQKAIERLRNKNPAATSERNADKACGPAANESDIKAVPEIDEQKSTKTSGDIPRAELSQALAPASSKTQTSCHTKAAPETEELKSTKTSGDVPRAGLSQAPTLTSSTTQTMSQKPRTGRPAPLSTADKERIVLNIEMETPIADDFVPKPNSASLVVNFMAFEPAARRASHASEDFTTDVIRIPAYPDASYRNSSAGIGVSYKISGRTTEWVDDMAAVQTVYDNHEAELVAISFTLVKLYAEAIEIIADQHHGCRNEVPLFIMIFSDSEAALDFINYHYLGAKKTSRLVIPQQIAKEMRRVISELIKMGCKIEINWAPGHAGVRGNVRANSLARIASSYGSKLKERGIRGLNPIYAISDLLIQRGPKSLAALKIGSKPSSESTRPWTADQVQNHIKDLLRGLGTESRYQSKLDRLIKGESPERVFAHQPREKKKRTRRETVDEDKDENAPSKKARTR